MEDSVPDFVAEIGPGAPSLFQEALRREQNHRALEGFRVFVHGELSITPASRLGG